MGTLVRKKAPDFKATAVVNGEEFKTISMSQYRGKYVVLFFYPLDFTFVCPTELHAFQEKLDEFEKRNVQVLACSVDSKNSHFAWLQTPKNQGGIQGIKYPVIEDLSKTISISYGVLAGDYTFDLDDEGTETISFDGAPFALRGLFLIDKEGIVRHELINDTPLGRNVDEVLRMVDALQYTEEKGEVCPANWEKGKDALKATTTGVANYLATH